MRVRRGKREMVQEHVFDSVHKDWRSSKGNTLIFIVLWLVGNFLSSSNSSARKMAEEPPVKY